MPIETTSGNTADNTGAAGLVEWSAGVTVPTAALFTALQTDLDAPASEIALPGVLATVTTTASGLSVVVPVGARWLARRVWEVKTATATLSVPDGAVSYVWACADGALRSTVGTTPPTGFTARDAFILVKATAAAGALTLDHTVQERARYGLMKTAVADPAALTAPTTISATYVQAEIQALRNDVAALRATVAALVDALQAANLA